MMASRGMGDISPSKMPKGVKKARRDDTDFTQYKKGGKVKSKRYEDGGDVKDTATAEKDVPKAEKEESKTQFNFRPMGANLSKQQKMAMGGSASSRADGVATKGKTKGMMIGMNKGGKAC